jgi:hypothetical protein
MPSVHHGLRNAKALVAAQSPGDERLSRPHLRSGDVCVGCIVWLPPRGDHEQPIMCNREGCCGREILEDAGYDHPVVVLSIWQKEHSTRIGDIVCSVACVSNFTYLNVKADCNLR